MQDSPRYSVCTTSLTRVFVFPRARDSSLYGLRTMYSYPYPADGQLYPFHHHPPGLFPGPVSSYSSSPSLGEKEGVRTVYVTNLPSDVTHREIHNLFRLSCPGFEACKFGKDRTDSQVRCAFASFVDRAAAMRAVQVLNRFRFDPQQPDLLLRVECAKTDDRSLTAKRSTDLHDLEKRRELRETSATDSPPPQQPPCCTLFVSGFLSITNEDLKPLFENSAGFVRFAMGKDGRHAFVTYTDLQSSTAAMNSLNGSKVGPTSTPILITYAKKVVLSATSSSGSLHQ